MTGGSRGGLIIGLLAGVVCYAAVCLKPAFKYDDSLDAFGVHGVGGFLGAVLTGVFCAKAVNSASVANEGLVLGGGMTQVGIQFKATIVAALFAFAVSFVLVKLVDLALGLITDDQSEIEGLDRTEHGEVGFDFGTPMDTTSVPTAEPRAALLPPNGGKRFKVVVDGVAPAELAKAWSDLCQPQTNGAIAEFKKVYPFLTTLQGNTFRFRGGNTDEIRDNLERLLRGRTGNQTVKVRVET